MAEVFTINKTGILEFENNRFKVNNSNKKLKSAGECIADHVTSSIHGFIKMYDYLDNDWKFTFVCSDRTLSDNFFGIKRKIELFSYNFDDNECIKRFIIVFIKLIKSIEEYLYLPPNFKRIDHLTYVYNHGELTFTSKIKLCSNTKSVRLDYKGNRLAEFTEYMNFSIKIIEYVHPIFSDWNVNIQGYEYRDDLILEALIKGKDIDMRSDAISWISKLEKYVIKNI